MRLTETARVLCALGILAALPLPADSKPGERPKLIEQKPIFDTSVLPKPSPFKLKIKHTDIAYPEPPTTLFRASGHFFALRAEEDKNVLKGEVKEEISPLSTSQHGIKSLFHHDLFAMVPKLAPDLTRQLDAQIEQSRRRLAGQVAREQPELEKELARKPVAAIPQLPAKASMPSTPVLPGRINMPAIPAATAQIPRADTPPAILSGEQRQPNLSSELEAARTQAKQDLNGGIKQASSQMRAALDQAKGGGAGMPPPSGPGMTGNAAMPPLPSGNGTPSPTADLDSLRKQPRVAIPEGERPSAIKTPTSVIAVLPSVMPNTDLNGKMRSAQKEIQAQLAAAGKINPNQDVNAQLLKAQGISAQATPQLDALMTRVRRLPTPDIPELLAVAKSMPFGGGGGDQTILWDAWHANFAKLAQQPLLRAFKKAGAPSGTNTVAITVSPDHRLSIKIAKPGNPKFDNAVIEAYKSLDKNPALAYPPGSLRSSVSFLIDNEHHTNGAVSGVKSHTAIGDKEIRRAKH